MILRRRSLIKRLFAPALGFIFSSVFLAALGLGVLFLIIRQHRAQSFPFLLPGAYQGEISGVGRNNSASSTFYVERFKNSYSLLLIIFQEGWKPLIIAAEQSSARPLGLTFLSPMEVFKPLSIKSGDKTLVLTGSGSSRNFSGEVISEGKKLGAWSLRSIAAKDLRHPSPIKPEKVNFQDWLGLLGKYLLMRQEAASLNTAINSKEEFEKQLSAFLADKTLMQQKSAEYKTEAQALIKMASARNETKSNEVKQLAREVDQLARITRRGQAVELARRVAKREAKWYQVYWQAAADLSGFEQSLAEKMNVDLLKLRSNVKKASEIQTLKAQIAEERSQIAQLQNTYEEKVKAASSQPSPGENNREAPSSRPWWKKWDSMFDRSE